VSLIKRKVPIPPKGDPEGRPVQASMTTPPTPPTASLYRVLMLWQLNSYISPLWDS
jgi:hypothetical protein